MNILLVLAIVGIVIILIVLTTYIITGTSEKRMEKKLTQMGNTAIKVRSNIINNNEEILKETMDKGVDISKNAIKTIARSVKEGLSDDDSMYCKYCGAQIDSDSKFCKECGKEI